MDIAHLHSCLTAANTALVSGSILADPADLPDEVFHYLLIQRRFVSLAFTPFYDATIDSLASPSARVVCRQVLREEYPNAAGNEPSHREHLVQDMVALGIARDVVLTARPTPATGTAILAAHELVPAARSERYAELAVIATAACYGESLVAAEYLALAPRIERSLPLEESVFYGPHLLHDSGHTNRLLAEVAGQLDMDDADQVRTFTDVVDRCLEVKLAFYRQFVDAPVTSSPEHDQAGAAPS